MNNVRQILKDLFGCTDLLRRRHHQIQPPPAEVTHAQIRVMDCLFRHPEHAMMLKDIAKELRLTPAAVSQTVDILVRRRRVVRETAPNNRRAVNIRLSGEGIRIKQQIDVFFEHLVESALREVPDDKLAVFTEVLQTFQRQLQSPANEDQQ